MMVRQCTNIYILRYFCTSRGSLDGLEAVGTNSVGQGGEGRLGCEKRFGTIQYYYYTVDSCCRTTRSNIIAL